MSSVLVFDHGLFCSLAERLSRDFDEVGYFSPWQAGPYPTGNALVLGYGLPGVTRVKHFFKEVDHYDLIVFPDCMDGDLQVYLRKQGKRVWGSGYGAELELFRWKTYQLLGDIGLPQNKAERVQGIPALREYLKEHERVWIKISTLRGLDETWFSENYELSRPKLDDMEGRYGAFLGDGIHFIVEEDIPNAVEVGYDGLCIDGQFPQTAVVGVEKKDKCYACQVLPYEELPPEVLAVNEGLAPTLREFQYRNWFSTEIRNDTLIDVTARIASPGGETYTELVKNLGEVLMAGAEGKLVEPVIEDEFGAQVMLTSQWSEKHWQALQFPEEIRPYVKLYHHCRINKVDYVVPQELQGMTHLGSVVATGDTMEEAKRVAIERAKQVKGYKVEGLGEELEEAIAEVEETV